MGMHASSHTRLGPVSTAALSLVLLLNPLGVAAARAQQPADTVMLTVGRRVERTIGGGGRHQYLVHLEAGQTLRAVAEQKGVDVVVALYSPAGAKLLEVDSPNGIDGPEHVRFVAQASGDHRMEIAALSPHAAVGRYEMLVQAVQSPAEVAAEEAAQPAPQSAAMRLGVAMLAAHRSFANLTYVTASGHEAKLDVYASLSLTPAPTLVYYHGGGWVEGSKEGAVIQTLPYLAMGWTVVNVEYRLAGTALAPAAVEDSRCALRYVLGRAKDFNIDTARVVLSGGSAGGHLALITGMLPVSAGLDRECGGGDDIHIAAIVNWFGVTDLVDGLEKPILGRYAIGWLGSPPDREALARRVSPLTYVRAGLPPIITVHGDVDPVVPYRQAVRLKDALDRVGVLNELVTIPGGEHGGFSAEATQRAFAAIEAFLTRAGVLR